MSFIIYTAHWRATGAGGHITANSLVRSGKWCGCGAYYYYIIMVKLLKYKT